MRSTWPSAVRHRGRPPGDLVFLPALRGNLRTAFLIVLPVAYVGSALLIAARKHLEADTQRLFEVVVEAATRQQVESQPSPE